MESSSSNKLLSIITASNRPHQMKAFLSNLNETIEDSRAIEVLVKIDEGDTAMYQVMQDAVNFYDFEIRYIQTSRLDGYYTLHYGYQELFYLSDPQTYFIFPVNEEVRFHTQGWDAILRKYVGLFPDHLFRLKISRLKYRNYYSYHDCGPCPENYPILTRRWMELAEGIGDCWGPDGWHQFIDYYLGLSPGINDIPGIFRSVPIMDITIGSEEAGKELTLEQVESRTHRICQEWWRMYSPAMQQCFRRLAIKMYIYIWTYHQNLLEYELQDNQKKKMYDIIVNGKFVTCFNYYLSPNYIRFKNFGFLMEKIRCNQIGFLQSYVYHSEMPKNTILKYLDRILRMLTVFLAILAAHLTSSYKRYDKVWPRPKAIIRTIMIILIGRQKSEYLIKFVKAKLGRKHAV